MLILQIRRASLSGENATAFDTLLSKVPEKFRPLIHQTLASQAGILGLPVEILRKSERRRSLAFRPRVPINGEVFTDGANLFVISLVERSRSQGAVSTRSEAAPREKERQKNFWLYLYYIGSELNSEALLTLEGVVNDAFNVTLKPYFYISDRFEELRAEGRTPPPVPSAEELASAVVLQDRAVRTLAIAIKASGGLLVRDLAKQLPVESRDRTDDVQQELQSAGLINAEIVVVCSKTQAQTARAPSREVLEQLSQQGLKCACGRPIAGERIEEALTITDHGRALLDGSRWLTLLLLQELDAVGVQIEKTLIEQQAGGDEMDLLADISGELALFELKDKEFSLGNAYSFGAKIGIIRPTHPIIVSTEYVGNDAKDHFQRARLALTGRPDEFISATEQSAEIRYIEGLANLRESIRTLATEIYFADAARILDETMQLASLDSRVLLRAVEARLATETTTNGSQPELASLGSNGSTT